MDLDRCFATIDLDNLLFNYNQAKKLVGKTKVLAVVKADAYGHGSIACAKHLEKNGCKNFAVASLKEAVELRTAGIKSDILIFGRTDPKNFKYLHEYDLIQTVYALDYAKILNDTKKLIRIHIDVDTGMSRFGLYLHRESELSQVVNEIKTIQGLKYLSFEGIYTHFANSDEVNTDFCNQQFTIYKLLIDRLNKLGMPTGIKHVGNSATVISHPDKYLDMVRFGIGLYGYPHERKMLDLKPVMSVFAYVTSTRIIQKNDTVSYGRTYQTKEPIKIATIAIGYGDGYNRLLSNKDYLVYNHKKLPVIGRVCMDAIMVLIKDTKIHEGDVVEIFGLNKPLEFMCDIVQTIPYELLCNVSKRVPRIYKTEETKN